LDHVIYGSYFLHILFIHETKIIILQNIICFFLAYITAQYITGHDQKISIEWAYIPIFIFTYLFGKLYYFFNETSHEADVSIAKSFGAGIAHEMRNPLSALHTSTDILHSILSSPTLTDSGHISLSPNELEMLQHVLTGMNEVLDSANETIDLILTSIDQNRVSTSTFRKHSVKTVVTYALQSFSYHSEKDRNMVHLYVENDFDFLGSDTLLKYAFYNLLKNSFYYRNSNQFSILITLKKQSGVNQITFEDNGVGIDSEKLEHVFQDFYTHGKNGGFGLGLPFCRRIMHSFGGQIECTSQLGAWTKFTLTFPDYSSRQVSQMKQEIIATKSILYIGNPESITSRLCAKQLLQKDGRLEMLSLNEALTHKEYEFEYDLIFIDLEQIHHAWYQLTELKRHLQFIEVRICYLFDSNHEYPAHINKLISSLSIDIHQLSSETGLNKMEEIIFDIDLSITDQHSMIPSIQTCHGKRILVVDDNNSVRKFTALLLEKQGYHVRQAKDGQEALNAIEKQTFDLILMDIEMPVLDGFETTKVIRQSVESYRHIPILGHTGDCQAKTLKKIQTSGMNDYVIKPVKKELLLGKLAHWI
jgi:two-component system CAI-1 autoinducer sensor kinase/phosphatase CqsS